jgi:hypothetical protein
VTVRDQERLDRVRALTDPAQPTAVTHWLIPQPGLSHDFTAGRSDDSVATPRPDAGAAPGKES